jgi:hypothetical protein
LALTPGAWAPASYSPRSKFEKALQSLAADSKLSSTMALMPLLCHLCFKRLCDNSREEQPTHQVSKSLGIPTLHLLQASGGIPSLNLKAFMNTIKQKRIRPKCRDDKHGWFDQFDLQEKSPAINKIGMWPIN